MNLKAFKLIPPVPGAQKSSLIGVAYLQPFGGIYGNGCDLFSWLGSSKIPPRENTPRALISSVFIVLALYTLLAICAIGLMPFEELINCNADVSEAVKYIPGVIWILHHHLVAVTAIIVILGSLSSCIMFQPRLEYAMARGRTILFNVLGRSILIMKLQVSPSSFRLRMHVFLCASVI